MSTFARDASSDERFARGQSVIGQGIRSVMCVPLEQRTRSSARCTSTARAALGQFSDEDLELLAAIGNHTGVALHRVRLLGELERLLLDTVRAIAATIDAKDGYTHRHSERVAALASRIAAEMGLGADQQELAELSALLHDVGKIAVPDSILNKPGRLTLEEFAEMRKHPVHGARILANIQSPLVSAVLPGVRYHHERWDGSGYPEGLSGDGDSAARPPARRRRLSRRADVCARVSRAKVARRGRAADRPRGRASISIRRLPTPSVRLHGRGALAPESEAFTLRTRTSDPSPR